MPSEASSLLLYDPKGHELVFTASRTLQSGVIDGMRLRCDQGIAGWVARHREAVRLDDATKDPRYYAGIETQTHFTPRTMLCVPMLSKDTLLGVIQVINKIDGSTFTEDELRLAQTLADHAAIAIENASLYRQAYVASITDDLTGLGNTRHFNRMLPELLARGGPVSLLVLDLDNFKAIVDTYGHLVGSRTIGYLGKVIAHLIRPGDVAARFGGDEFVIILPDTDAETARGIAETIRAADRVVQHARRQRRRHLDRHRERRRRHVPGSREHGGGALPGRRRARCTPSSAAARTPSPSPARPLRPGIDAPAAFPDLERTTVEETHAAGSDNVSSLSVSLAIALLAATLIAARRSAELPADVKTRAGEQQVRLHLLDAQGRQPRQAGRDLVPLPQRRRLRRHAADLVARRRIKKGRTTAKIAVGKVDGPSFMATGAIVNDPDVHGHASRPTPRSIPTAGRSSSRSSAPGSRTAAAC